MTAFDGRFPDRCVWKGKNHTRILKLRGTSMEIKNWTYEEFPEFTEVIDGVEVIDTTRDEASID